MLFSSIRTLLLSQRVCSMDRGFPGHNHGKPWIQLLRFTESAAAYEHWPARGLLLCLAPQSGASNPEWVCGCASICHRVGRPRCSFRSHSGNRAVEWVQSQAFRRLCKRSQPVLNAVVKLHSNYPYPSKNDIMPKGIIVCIVALR